MKKRARRKAREFWVVVSRGGQALYVNWRENISDPEEVIELARGEYQSCEQRALEAIVVREVLPRRKRR